jgi:hypothetical protein
MSTVDQEMTSTMPAIERCTKLREYIKRRLTLQHLLLWLPLALLLLPSTMPTLNVKPGLTSGETRDGVNEEVTMMTTLPSLATRNPKRQ